MTEAPYSYLTDAQLIAAVEDKDDATDLEVELTLRLVAALEELGVIMEDDPLEH